MQAPLKERYRDDPNAATITLRAEGTVGEGVACSVATCQALVEAGLHAATGGDGLTLCSGDMLLQALVAAPASRCRLQTDADDEQLATLLRLTERYCVVHQTLSIPPDIEVSLT